MPTSVTADRSVPSRSGMRSVLSVPPPWRSPRRRQDRFGPEAVHLAERGVGVLGEVGGAAAVEGHRLVLEAPEPDERRGVAALVGIHLEHVAVAHAVDDLVDLLAGQPRAPRRRAAGAVVERARQADRRATRARGGGRPRAWWCRRCRWGRRSGAPAVGTGMAPSSSTSSGSTSWLRTSRVRRPRPPNAAIPSWRLGTGAPESSTSVPAIENGHVAEARGQVEQAGGIGHEGAVAGAAATVAGGSRGSRRPPSRGPAPASRPWRGPPRRHRRGAGTSVGASSSWPGRYGSSPNGRPPARDRRMHARRRRGERSPVRSPRAGSAPLRDDPADDLDRPPGEVGDHEHQQQLEVPRRLRRPPRPRPRPSARRRPDRTSGTSRPGRASWGSGSGYRSRTTAWGRRRRRVETRARGGPRFGSPGRVGAGTGDPSQRSRTLRRDPPARPPGPPARRPVDVGP